jgi:hypothetical protein
MNHFLKNHCLAVLALALLLVIAAPALADETRGNIALIDPDNHTFTLVDENNNVLQLRFLVGGDVRINDQEATIWDLQPGDPVTVNYDRSNGELLANAIETRRQ